MIEIGKYGWKKFTYSWECSYNWMSSFNSAVAQNKEHLMEMLNRQSVSTVYNLIKLYTVKLQNMQKNMQNIYTYAKM